MEDEVIDFSTQAISQGKGSKLLDNDNSQTALGRVVAVKASKVEEDDDQIVEKSELDKKND